MPTPENATDKASQVAATALSLVNNRQMPTVQKIRDQIGGSPNEIAPLLKAWKESPAGVAALQQLKGTVIPAQLDTDKAVDDALLAVLEPLRVQLRDEGQQAANQIEAEKNTAIVQLKEQLVTMRTELGETQQRLDTLTGEHQLLRVDRDGALKTLAETKESLVRFEEREQALQRELADAHIARQRADTQAERDRDALENFRTRAAEQRRTDQQAHQTAIAEGKAELERERQSQALATDRHAQEHKEWRAQQERLREQLNQLQLTHQHLAETTVPTLNTQITEQREQLDEADQVKSDLQRAGRQLAEQAAALQSAERDRAQLEKLQSQLEIAQTQLTNSLQSQTEKDRQLAEALAQIRQLTAQLTPTDQPPPTGQTR